MDCLCNVGQLCTFPGCTKRGERDGVIADPRIPGSAWCLDHGAELYAERLRIWQERVRAREERERAG